MSTIQDAIAAIQDVAGGLTNMKEAPDYAPDSINVFPFTVSYPERGRWGGLGGKTAKTGIHTIVSEIHVARPDLPSAIQSAIGFCETFPNALLADPTLAGTVQTIVDEVTYEFMGFEYAGIKTVGWQFRITVKQISAIT